MKVQIATSNILLCSIAGFAERYEVASEVFIIIMTTMCVSDKSLIIVFAEARAREKAS